MSHPRRLLVALMVSTVVVAGACATDSEAPATAEPASNTFNVLWTQAEGHAMELSGDTTGHRTADASTFMVTLYNPTDDEWASEFCLALIASGGVETLLVREEFTVPAGGERSFPLEVVLPGEASNRSGIALIEPGRGASVSQIQVNGGRAADEGTGATTSTPGRPGLMTCPS